MTYIQHLLTVLAEECAETAVRASKAIRFGMSEAQEGQDKTNKERLEYEFNDILALAVELGLREDEGMINAKLRKLREYVAYSMNDCATVDDSCPHDAPAGWRALNGSEEEGEKPKYALYYWDGWHRADEPGDEGKWCQHWYAVIDDRLPEAAKQALRDAFDALEFHPKAWPETWDK